MDLLDFAVGCFVHFLSRRHVFCGEYAGTTLSEMFLSKEVD